jgi:hypothetical protein
MTDEQNSSKELRRIIKEETARALYAIAKDASDAGRGEYDSVTVTALATTELYLRNGAQRLWASVIGEHTKCATCGHKHGVNGPAGVCSERAGGPVTMTSVHEWCACAAFIWPEDVQDEARNQPPPPRTKNPFLSQGVAVADVLRNNCAFCHRERVAPKDDNHAPDCPYWDFH